MKKETDKQVYKDLYGKVNEFYSATQAYYEGNLDALNTAIKVAQEDVNNNNVKLNKINKVNTQITNQITKKTSNVSIANFEVAGKSIFKKYELVDKIANLSGSAVTIFQKIDQGFLRVSTNIIKNDGNRATGTYIPTDSPVYKTIMNKKTFRGRAYVVNSWYLTVYKPIIVNDEVVGATFVGKAEANLEKIKQQIRSKSFGKTGFAFIANPDGKLIAHPTKEGDTLAKIKYDDKVSLIDKFNSKNEDFIFANWEDGQNKAIAYRNFENMNWVIAAAINQDEIYQPLKELQFFIFYISLAVIIGSSLLAYFMQGTISGPLIAISNSLNLICSKIDRSAETLFSKSNDLKDKTSTQASNLNETAQSVNYIKKSIESTNEAINLSAKSSEKGIQATKDG